MRAKRFDFRQLPPFHPIPFAMYPVLALFAHNQDDLKLFMLFEPLIASAALAGLVWAAIGWRERNAHGAALAASLMALMFFSYGHLLNALADAWLFGLYLGSPRMTFLFWSLALAFGCYFCLKARKALAPLTVACNMISIFLIASPLASIVWRQQAVLAARGAHAATMERIRLSAPALEGEAPPDIYHIILDGYARHDVLRDIYGYDNSEFLDFLRQRGFQIVERSRANYPHTYLSIASTLNLSYLPELAAEREMPLNFTTATAWLKDNEAMRFLRRRGYRTAAFRTGYFVTEIESADVFLSLGHGLSDFDYYLLDTTPLATLAHDFLLHARYEGCRRRIEFIFDSLGRIDSADAPLFVFAHIIAPHPPFVFLENGDPIDPNVPFVLADGGPLFRNPDDYVSGYSHQIRHITRKAEEAIERILANSPRPPIVILQADHGPASRFSLQTTAERDLKERFSILNALLLPDGRAEDLSDDVSPVNTFRIVFDRYFGAGLELLPDRSYLLESPPDGFRDVTAEAIQGAE